MDYILTADVIENIGTTHDRIDAILSDSDNDSLLSQIQRKYDDDANQNAHADESDIEELKLEEGLNAI